MIWSQVFLVTYISNTAVTSDFTFVEICSKLVVLIALGLLFIGYKDVKCKSPVKELDEESYGNDDFGSDVINIDDNTLKNIASEIWMSEQDLDVEYDGTPHGQGNLR